MLKRLLFAVFVLGLVFSLSGTAISGIGQKPAEALNALPAPTPNAQYYNEVRDALPAEPTQRPANVDVQELPNLGPLVRPPSVSFCDYDFSYGAAAYFWGVGTETVMATRFSVGAQMSCTTLSAWVITYGPAAEGVADVRIYLYDDDGFGYPGNKLDSGTILNADLAHDYAYETVSWTNGPWVFEDGASYHIGYTNLGGPADNYPIISDACDGLQEGRNSVFFDGGWVTSTFYGGDGCEYGWAIESEVCCGEIPYSDCYSQDYIIGVASYWPTPHPASTKRRNYGMRFDVATLETLSSVDIAVYDYGTDEVAGSTAGTNDVICNVWDDTDNDGLPNNLLGSVTIAVGDYVMYPSFQEFDFYSQGIVLQPGQTFFATFNSTGVSNGDGTGTYEACLSDGGDELNGNRSISEPFRTPPADWVWETTWTSYGADFGFLIAANLCRDPFWDCTVSWHDVGAAWFWNLPDAYGDVASAQSFKAIGECEVGEVSWALYDWSGSGINYTYDSKVSVYTDDGGYPGTELASITLTPADYALFPAYTTVDFASQHVIVSDKYWVAIESFAPTEDEGIATLTDAGGGGWELGAAELWGSTWGLLTDDWNGVPTDVAFAVDAAICCIPPDDRICADVVARNGTEWATTQQNQQRDGASGVAFGDAQCDLTVQWCYLHPLKSIFDTGPAIVGDKIVCAFQDEVKVFDLASGAEIYTVVPGAGSSILRHVPTIANGVMYLGGDDQQSVSAWNFATGAMIWRRDIGTVGPGGLFGVTRYTSFILLDQGGTEVLYWGTDGGAIVAADAATGNLYAGWGTNPVQLGQGVRKSGSTDGTSLYFNSYPGGVDGDVWSIDAASGAINWQLSTAGGLQANTIFPEGPQLGEGFPGGNSVDAVLGVVFVNSNIAQSYYPGDGVMYAINASDGSIKWAVPSAGARGETASGTPIIDIARIYYAAQSLWASPIAGGRILAFSAKTGALVWALDTDEYNNNWGDAALSCEPDGADDLLFVAGHHGFISTINSRTGEEIYRRRTATGGYPNEVTLAFAISEGNLAMSDAYGRLYVWRKGDDRPRLEIQSYQPELSVEFGNDPNLHVYMYDEFVNTGCTDLEFLSFTIDDSPTHPWLPAFAPANVRSDVMARAASIADKLTNNLVMKATRFTRESDLDDFYVRRDRGEQMLNSGANAIPNFIQLNTYPNGVVSPQAGDFLEAGGSADLVIDVNQPFILRGPQDFYMVIDSDDPDFFVNYGCNPTYGPPEIHVTLVGGCLSDTVTMPFGMGGANIQLVTNTGRLGIGDWTPHALDIDGDAGSFYQGGLIYGTSQYSLALNCHAWYGQGPAFSWRSMQPDPTWCDDVCAIELVEDVTLSCLGGYSEDGVTYTPIMGNTVCATYLDSVQDFSLGGTVEWEWANFSAPFDNDLTMGLVVNSRTIAAVDFAPFANLTIDIMEITERNGLPVEGWKMGAYVDYDIGNDRAVLDQEGSVAFQSSGGVGDTQWGMMKFPFGCGTNPNVDFNPMKNAVSGHGNGMFYDQYSPPYLDSAYMWMSRPAGLYSQAINSDEEFHCTIAEHDFVGGDTYELAVAQFALHGTDGTSAEAVALAKLANKWLGFGRGDVNGDGVFDLSDILYLANYVNGNGPGPIPFMHMGDVDCDGDVDMDDVLYLIAWYFADGPCPCGDWCF